MALDLLACALVAIVAFALIVLNWVIQRAFSENRDFAKHVLDENRELIRLLALKQDMRATQQVIHATQQVEARQHQPAPEPEPYLEPQH